MTAFDYINCSEFKAFAKLWVEEKLPIEFADWLRDRDLDLQADAVIFANTFDLEGVRPPSRGYLRPFTNKKPANTIDNYEWDTIYWGKATYRSCLPNCMRNYLKVEARDTPEESVADYLEAYAESRENGAAARANCE